MILPFAGERTGPHQLLAAAFAIAAATTSITIPVSAQERATNAAQDPPVFVTFGPHYRPAFMESGTETYRCPGAILIRIASTYTWHAGPRRRQQVTSIAIGGRMVGEAAIARVNAAFNLQPPESLLSPQCHRDRVRLHLYQRAGERTAEGAYIDLD
jgi:hypothetical protein